MLSRILRRVHMYLALFLTPWVLMYAVSTIAMNHSREEERTPDYVREREITWTQAPASRSSDHRSAALQLLRQLGLEGAHSVSVSSDSVVIQRQDALAPRRITWIPADKRVIVERQVFRAASFLEQMHRRRGYHHPYWADLAWAVSVDLVIVSLVFWGFSGVWLWLDMKRTRLVGAFFLIGGVVVFALFVALA
jgi:hypothetical protein